MFMVGNVSEKAQELCQITKHALDEAIKICGPGVPVREVGKVRNTAAAIIAQRPYQCHCGSSVSMHLIHTQITLYTASLLKSSIHLQFCVSSPFAQCQA